MMTTSEIEERNTPPSMAVAPMSAYTPGWMSHASGSASRNMSPRQPPPQAPRKMLGMKIPPGTAVPNAKIIMTRYKPEHTARPLGVNPYGWPQECSPIESIQPMVLSGEEKKVVATSLM
jgi:hypothetical protein